MEAMDFFSQHCTRLPTLNADAWRSLLDGLETRDVVRLGAVCREWRDAVNKYLEGVHGFAILRESNMADAKYRLVQLSDLALVRAMFRNLGRHMTRVTTDGGRDWIQAIAENCPGLREITLHNVPDDSNEELQNLWRCCRALKRVSFRSSKWVDDGFTFYLNHLTKIEIEQNERVTGAFLNLVNRPLETLSLKECIELQPGQFQRNVEKLANITKFELDCCPSVVEEVPQLLGAMPQLQELSLSHYRRDYDQSSIEDLAVAISRLNLKILRMRRNVVVDDGFLEIAARGCRNLQTLELPGCNGHYCRSGVTDAGIAAIARNCRRLRYLDLSSLHSLTSQGLSVLGSCPDLDTLALRSNEGIKERAFFLMVKSCPNLRLHNVPDDSNEELQNLWRCCRALKRVSFRCSKWVDDGFTFYLNHLTNIEIEQNERVTGAFLNLVNRPLETLSLKECIELQPGQFQRNVEKLANITKFELDCCPSVVEEVPQLLGAMPQLQELSLSHCRRDYDQSSIEDLAVAISRLKLKILRMRRNVVVDDGFLEIVARGCRNLETLELPGCNGHYCRSGVTDAGIAAIARNCRRLRYLDLSSLHSLTSQGLSVLGSCPDLDTLALRSNEGIKERAFFLMVKSCPNLRTLDARGCAAATSRLVQEIARIVPARRQALALLLAATSVQQQDITELISKLGGRLTVTLDGSEQEPWERHYTTMVEAGVYDQIPQWPGNEENHWGVMDVDNNDE